MPQTGCMNMATRAMTDEIRQTAEAKDVNILGSGEPIYETAVKLAGLIA